MAFYVGNFYLSSSQMQENAETLWPAMQALGWSDWAIAAILGNMQTESSLNPGIWQGLDEGNMSGGYGLVQWTPASKFISWADSNGYAQDDYSGQLARIVWEEQNGEQYYPTSAYPLSFNEFLNYTPQEGESDEEVCKWLAAAWVKNYERPKNQNQPQRGEQAWRWFQIFHDGNPAPPPEPPEPPPDPPGPEPENEYKYLWNVGGIFWFLVRDSGPAFVINHHVTRISRQVVKYKGVLFFSIGGRFYKAMGTEGE